jgi:hypothetical protein
MVTGHGIFMRRTLGKLGIAGLMAGLCACSGADGRYPSLAVRPFETAAPVAPAPAPNKPIRPVATAAEIAALVQRAKAAHQAFAAQQDEAERRTLAAAGQGTESNARAAALVAMADLSSQRGTTSAVLADLDLLVMEASSRFASDPALDSARAEVAALLASEDAVMAKLWEGMGS